MRGFAMKKLISIIGAILIILGIFGFSYKYFSYMTNEKVLEVGNVKVTAETENVIMITPLVSAIMLGTGIVLVIIGVSRKL
jgi:hypothetical protein